MTHTKARALLLKYGWSVDRALQAFFDDNAFVFEDPPVDKEGGDFLCESCYGEYEPKEVITMPDCGHKLCEYCFTAMLEHKMSTGPESLLTKCPEQKCTNTVPQNIFKELVSPELFEKYEKYSIQSFVDLSANAKWCPGKECEWVIY